MMKIKNKQFFNRNVILGGTAVYAEEPQKFTLDEYVVTATRTELSRKEVPQSVEVITKEDIQNIGATNVIDALRTATNIEIPEAAGVGHTLGIRGSGKNDVLVLLNGRRIPGEGYLCAVTAECEQYRTNRSASRAIRCIIWIRGLSWCY